MLLEILSVEEDSGSHPGEGEDRQLALHDQDHEHVAGCGESIRVYHQKGEREREINMILPFLNEPFCVYSFIYFRLFKNN